MRYGVHRPPPASGSTGSTTPSLAGGSARGLPAGPSGSGVGRAPFTSSAGLRVYLSAYARWLEPTNPDDAGSVLRLPATVVIDTGIDQVRLDQAAVGALTTALQRLGNAPQPNQNGSTPVPYDNLINCCDLAGRRGTIVVLADHGRVLMITATGETTVLDLPQTGQLRAALRDAALDAARHPVDTS
jgi:hypothetical protein